MSSFSLYGKHAVNNTFAAEKINEPSFDTIFLILIVLLSGVGVTALFSSSYHFAENVFGSPFHFVFKQLTWLILGAISAFAASKISFDLIKRYIPVIMFISIGINLLLFIPGLGIESGGARRWLEIGGFSFQPSELIRLSLVLYVAKMLENNKDRMKDFSKAIVPQMLIILISTLVVYSQNDFSSAALIFAVAFLMLIIGGISSVFVIALGASGSLAAFIMLNAKPYRISRIVSWLNPELDPDGAGYQVLTARSALQSGGFWGEGFGQSTMKLGALPQAHSDFVFAIIGEEAGYVGVLFVFVLFGLFAWRGYSIAMKSEGTFEKYTAFGLTTAVYLQALTNMSVVCGLVPATGIPLPLFSTGGSTSLITLLIFGLLLNISRNNNSSKSLEI
ncbi:MAG: putative lipid II flippase FtsW [Spirochaetaceae bacterium]|jgi:cell division protein FtsW|nr:putative lipid II flippase FtsW [Spirochaetaceae bacterium]